MRVLSKSLANIILLLFISNLCFAQWQVDHQFGMKINVPSDWSKKSYKDGTDQVYEFYSSDGTVAITLRAFAADPSLTMDLLVQVYEQAMMPAGTQRQLYEDFTSYNGIPGKQAVYQVNQQGNLVNIMCFYTIQNGNAYVLTGVIPNQVMGQKEAEIKSVTQSFTINGFERKTQSQNAKILPKPPVQGSGARPNNQSTSNSAAVQRGSIVGKYNFASRSDGKVLTNYHYIVIHANGTYEEKYEPKNSPGYQGGNNGNWKKNGNKLSLNHQGGNIADSYTIVGNELHRLTSSGIKFIFRKQ